MQYANIDFTETHTRVQVREGKAVYRDNDNLPLYIHISFVNVEKYISTRDNFTIFTGKNLIKTYKYINIIFCRCIHIKYGSFADLKRINTAVLVPGILQKTSNTYKFAMVTINIMKKYRENVHTQRIQFVDVPFTGFTLGKRTYIRYLEFQRQCSQIRYAIKTPAGINNNKIFFSTVDRN